jgi:hypothetical protein
MFKNTSPLPKHVVMSFTTQKEKDAVPDSKQSDEDAPEIEKYHCHGVAVWC